MKGKWKTMNQFIPGVGKVYRAYRLLDTKQPMHSGNVEFYGDYSEDCDEVEETVERLNAMEERQEETRAQKCPVCGREFVPTPQWHWSAGRIKFCRYHCYLKRGPILEAERKKARSYRSKGRVRKLLPDGAEAFYEDIEAASKATGIPKNVIRAACSSGIADPMGNRWEYENKEENKT